MSLILQTFSGYSWIEILIGVMILLFILRIAFFFFMMRKRQQNMQQRPGMQQQGGRQWQGPGGRRMGMGGMQGQGATPEQILQRRFARGEITQEQYEQMMSTLKKQN